MDGVVLSAMVRYFRILDSTRLELYSNTLQIKGPATRGTALITFANYLIAQGNTTYPTNTIWPVSTLIETFISKIKH